MNSRSYNMAEGHLHYGDYIVFGGVILLFLGLAILICVLGRKRNTVVEFLFGGRNMAVLPVIVAMTMTFMTPFTMLGFPSEVYYFGVEFILIGLSQAIGVGLAAILFVPLLHPLQLTSTNQYLYMRYGSRTAQHIGSIFQGLQLMLAFILFISGPSIVFDKATDCPMWAATLILGISATIYTTLGGMKALIWSQVCQLVMMLGGLLTVFVTATMKSGGPSHMWDLYSYGGRLDVSLLPSLWRRWDVWSVGLFQFCLWFILFGVSQMSVQKYSTLPSMRTAVMSMLGVIPGVLCITVLACLCGVSAFAYFSYRGCSPFSHGTPGSLVYQGILPHLVMEILPYPAVPGFLITVVFCTSLSISSQVLTSLSAFTWDDFLSRRYINLSEGKKTYICKILVVLYGIACTALSYALFVIRGPVFEVAFKLLPLLTVPVGIMFLVGATFARVNSVNAIASSITGFSAVLFLFIGSLLHGSPAQPLPTMTAICYQSSSNSSMPINHSANNTNNFTYSILQQNYTSYTDSDISLLSLSPTNEYVFNSTIKESNAMDYIWNISYTWYPVLGGFLGFLLSLFLSIFNGCKTKHEVDDRLLFACLRMCYRKHNHRYHVASYHDDAASEIEYEMSDIHRRKTPLTPQLQPKFEFRNTLVSQTSKTDTQKSNNNSDTQKALQNLL